MKFKYTNRDKVMHSVEFPDGHQFLFCGQSINSSVKAVSVPSGVIESQIKQPRRSKPAVDNDSE